MICFLNLAEAVPKGIPSCAGLPWLTAVLTLNARRRKEELDSQVLSPHRFLSERGKWDSNPRVSDHLWFSRPAHSSALPYPRAPDYTIFGRRRTQHHGRVRSYEPIRY